MAPNRIRRRAASNPATGHQGRRAVAGVVEHRRSRSDEARMRVLAQTAGVLSELDAAVRGELGADAASKAEVVVNLEGEVRTARLRGSGGDVAEQVIDEKGRPQDGFDDGPHMGPEAVGMLPVVHDSPDEPQAINRASAAAPHGGSGLRRA